MKLTLPTIGRFHIKNIRHVHLAMLVCIIVLVGLFVRFGFAPSPGFEFDVGVNQGWGRSAFELGLARSYVEQVNNNMLPNYAPFTIMLFTGSAYLQDWFFGGFDNAETYRVLIKIPAMLADIITAIALFFFVKRWKGIVIAYAAALLLVFHPAVIYESAVWGQTDSIFTMFLVLGTGFFAYKKPMLAGVMFALAALSKMQAGMLVPFFFVLYASGGWRVLLKGTVGGLLITIPILIPFAVGGTLPNVIDVYTNSVGFYSIVSSAAYNFWWALYADAAGNTQDTSLLFGFLSFKQWGLLFFGLSNIYVLALLWRHLRASSNTQASFASYWIATAFVSHAFFVWNTQMHERYLFPFVALGLPMIWASRRFAFIYVSVSILFFLNLLGWLPAGPIDRALFEIFPALDGFIASLQVVFFFMFAAEIVRFAREHRSKKATHQSMLQQFSALP